VPTFQGIPTLANHIEDRFAHGGKSGQPLGIVAIYAFNTTGKTRLARTLYDAHQSNDESITVMSYGALFEDMFLWDNDKLVLYFNVEQSWLLQTIRDEGLENRVADYFKTYSYSKVEPVFDFTTSAVTFNVATGDDDNIENIKASKGEESLLVWAIFRTILGLALDTLGEKPDDRSTNLFDNLQYIIIDDPVSSIDDTKLINMAVDLVEVMKQLADSGIKVLVLTHHALFYNIIYTSNLESSKKFCLTKQPDGTLMLSGQGEAPFAHHLYAKQLIQTAIDTNTVERYHFNLFRALCEKTANFLGYNEWKDCLQASDLAMRTRLINLYSHGKLAETEPKQLATEDIEMFSEMFRQFVKDFKWSN